MTNIGGNGGTLLQRAARLEKMTELGWILDLGVDPKALADDGEVHSPDDDDVVNISPLSIAIKKNNYEMWTLMMNKNTTNTTDAQYLELLFDVIEWAGPSVAKSQKVYDDFKGQFKDMLNYPSVHEVSSKKLNKNSRYIHSIYYEYVWHR